MQERLHSIIVGLALISKYFEVREEQKRGRVLHGRANHRADSYLNTLLSMKVDHTLLHLAVPHIDFVAYKTKGNRKISTVSRPHSRCSRMVSQY